MKKKIFFILSFLLFLPHSLLAKYGLDTAAGAAGLGTSTAQSDITIVISNVVNIALSMVGVIFLILFIYGGFKWMLSRGASKEIEDAKNILTAAVIGMVIIFSAYIITSFVITSLVSTAG